MGGQSGDEFEQERRRASDDAFKGRGAYHPTDLLPPKARAALRAAAASWRLQRTTRAMEKWAQLIEKATETPRSLGFVPVPSGGTATFAKAWGSSPGGVTRSLDAWENKGAIIQFRQKGPRGLPKLVGIQVPELTDALVWLAGRTYYQLEGSGAGGSPMTIPQAQKIAADLLTRHVPLRGDWTTFAQAATTLDLIRAGAPVDAFAMTMPTLTPTYSRPTPR